MSEDLNAGGFAAPASDTPLSLSDAVASLNARRDRDDTKTPEPVDRAPVEAPAEPDARHESAEEVDAAAAEQPPGETEADDPADDDLPSIDPPKSWTKEQKDRWAALPRETQEYIAERERARDTELRRGQNEIAEQRKAVEAEKAQAAQAKAQYERALPALLQQLQAQQAGAFPDIKSWDDVQRMAREDWPRYVEWDASQKRLHAVAQETQRAVARQQQESVQEFETFRKEQLRLLNEKIPDLKDPEKAVKAQKATVELLKDIGLSDAEMQDILTGQRGISLHDHRAQLLIWEALQYRQAKAQAKAVAPKPLPPVQRPGTATSRSDVNQTAIANLSNRLERATSTADQLRIAAELRQAKRAQAERKRA